jgi:hypothetical protein
MANARTVMAEAKGAAIRHALTLIDLHAQYRRHDIEDGLITPRYAAVMVIKHAQGMGELLCEQFGPKAAASIWKAQEAIVRELDPVYQTNRTRREAARPLDFAA